MTRTKDEYEQALSLFQSGLTTAAVARQTGIPRRTVHDWRVGLVPSAFAALACGCKEHGFNALPSSAYVYILGLYLGDGYLARHPRKVRRLRVSLDAKYPGIITEAVQAMRAVIPGRTASVQPIGGHVEVYSYARRWACLLPQDGPGLKHERPIILQSWQRAHIELEPNAAVGQV